MLNNIFSFYLIERKINFILFFKFKFKNDSIKYFFIYYMERSLNRYKK